MHETTMFPNDNGRGVGLVPPEAHITQLVIFEVGTYAQQYRRPWETNYTGGIVQQFQEASMGATSYDAATFGGVAMSFLKPTAAPEAPVNIINGWGNRHAKFLMTIEYNSSVGTRMQSVLTGYTESNEGIIGANGMSVAMGAGLVNVANDLKFTINSVIRVRKTRDFGPNGFQETQMVADNSHLLVDPGFESMYNQGARSERMRPTDVFATMVRAPLAHAARRENSQPGGGMWDQRTATTNLAVKSRRSNVIPSNFVGRIIDNYNNAMHQSADPTRAGTEVYNNARSFTRDELVSSDEVLNMLSEVNGEPIGNTFQFRHLLRLDPSIAGRVQGRVSGGTQRVAAHEAGQTMNWDGSDGITLAATIISQCVPAIMADLGLSKLQFKMHNMFATSGGYSSVDPTTHVGSASYIPEFVVLRARGFGDQDYTPQLKQLELRFWFEVMKDLTYQNQVAFMVEVTADLIGETVINISMDSSEMRQYVTPSFADASLVPLVTQNFDRPLQVAEDFNVLMDAVVSHGQQATLAPLSPTPGGRNF